MPADLPHPRDDAPAATPVAVRRGRRAAWLFSGLALLLVALVLAAGSGLWWAVRSESGSAWLLRQLPGLQVGGGRGTLWGDYEADRIDYALPGGGRLVMTQVGWRGLHLLHEPAAAYRTRVAISELHAQRVDLLLPSGGQHETPQPPASLRLPVALDIGAVRIGELHASALGGQPLRALRGRLHLGAAAADAHRLDDFAVAWDRLQASGAAHIATSAPFDLDVTMDVVQQAAQDATAWRARAALSGPLAEPALTATVRATPAGPRPAQSLDLRATLRPFAAWPLGELQASTRALDLSALHSGLPLTALSGEARAQTRAADQPATVTATLDNAEAGRWNEGRLPVRGVALELGVRPSNARDIELRRLDVQLGTRQQTAGRIDGRGRWSPQQWNLAATLAAVQPSLLDARAATVLLNGPVTAAGHDFGGAADQARVDLKAELSGQFAAGGPARTAQLSVDASGSMRRIELRQAQARIAGARASLSGVGTQPSPGAPWHLKGEASLVDFDPAPWWPGSADSPLRKGPNRLNAHAALDLAVPMPEGAPALVDRLAALRGRAELHVADSVLAGVPLAADATLRSADGRSALASLKLDAGGNRVSADGRLDEGRQGAGDQWDLAIAAPALNRLAPLWRLGAAPPGEAALAGALNATARVDGRWPRIATQGQLEGSALRVGQTQVQRAQARWQMDSHADAALDLQTSLSGVSFSQALFKGTPPIESAQLALKGTMRSHRLELRADTRALPPAWTEALQPPAPGAGPGGSAHTTGVLILQGGAIEAPAGRPSDGHWRGWRGTLQQLELRSSDVRVAPWVRTQDVGLEFQSGGGPTRVLVQPGRAQLLGAVLRWSRIGWQAAAAGRPAQIDAQAELDPVPVAPLLARLQPAFGWGGDLAVVGHVNLRSAPSFTADVVLERQHGDLTVTDETGRTQALGLSDLRVGLDVRDGVWSFTQGLAGRTLGVAAGAVVARTSPQATWPAPDSPVQGVLEVQVADLGTWGPWLPPGWRLNGALRTSAGIGGRFGAPEYTGEVRGSGIGVRNFLQGVNVTDGDIAIALQGATARIERFSARAGNGNVKLEGDATLGAAPTARLSLRADKFQLLGRVDRRVITSGQAQLQLDSRTLALDGKFAIDEGLIDVSVSNAPRLSDDVEVVRAKRPEAAETAQAAPSANPAPGHTVKLDLQVSLGERLRLRGHGIDTGLRGDLRITSPNNGLALDGTVRAVDGTYAAYGQKLTIDRGLITFIGPAEDPRLDIEATRPNTDVRVGVLVSGTALNPRVRLFSEPEMADIDKLSWLVLGRANDSLGRTDTALLQRAALALLAGEGGGVSDQFTKAIGLDEVSLRQTEGEVRETVISLGKQLSRRWFVGYERSLTATTGSWQLIYRIAQRFTLRAQTGADSSLDLIWTWRWQ